jgi:hypothetical protein
MQKDFIPFLKAIFIFSFIVGLLAFVFSVFLPENKVNAITWFQLLYFIFITLIFQLGLLKSSKGRPQSFVRYYMGATAFKLFVHVIIILMYCLFNRNDAVRFILTFLIFYIFYTVFEVAFAAQRFRKVSSEK